GPEGTAGLLAEMLGEMPSGGELVALVHGHTDGNPYFTQQVVRTLIENGSLYRREGAWERLPLHEIEVPESVRSVIGQRVERLPERKRRRRAAELVMHWFDGDEPERALPYALVAGDEAEAVFAHAEAERHYRMALELVKEGDSGDGRERAWALEKLGGVLKV